MSHPVANIKRVAYAVSDTSSKEGDEKSRWTRIGASFLNKDGSESVLLDALPTNGKIVLQEPKEQDQK